MADTMTKQQIEHLQKRITETIQKAVDKFQSRFPAPETMTNAQKMQAIKSGTAKLDHQLKADNYTRLYDAFIFPIQEEQELDKKKQDQQIKKFSDPLYEEGMCIMDAAILGGADAALASLNQFMKKLKV